MGRYFAFADDVLLIRATDISLLEFVVNINLIIYLKCFVDNKLIQNNLHNF